jgi:dimethylargininase
MFRHAIVRPPSSNFAEGLTSVDLGVPDFALALEQHARYCDALEACGLALTRLPADPRHPDGTFVEDAAVLVGSQAIITRPGAPSRAGEVEAVEAALAPFFARRSRIMSPGTLDGGDVCEAGDRVLIGISARTNEEGAGQLASYLTDQGIASTFIDIRDTVGLLHLKSGISWLGEGRLAANGTLAEHPGLRGFEIVQVEAGEAYAANCVRVNGRVLAASGFPRFEGDLRARGYDPLVVDVSEFEKMDGGLSCLSLRF